MNISEIENSIEVLKSCQYCWADQVANDDQAVSDYDAIEQAIECLNGWKKWKEIKSQQFEKIT